MLLFLACADPAPKPDTGDTGAPAVEVCNGVDDNGDGAVDEGLALYTFYADNDGDGFGGGEGVSDCAPPTGHLLVDGDCDDADPAVHPDAAEVCDAAARDEDCDGVADPDGATGCTDTYGDVDGDSLGGGAAVCRCDPTGHATESTDCDDTDVDRGADCSEGVEVPIVGATVRDDDPDAAWTLLGAYDAGIDADGRDAGQALFLDGRDAGITIAALPASGDALLSAARLTTIAVTPYADHALGDLDGSGAVSLLEASYVDVFDPDDYTDEFAYETTTLRAVTAPLLADGATDWSWELDTAYTSSFAHALFVEDLDGDGVGEGWYSLGERPAYVGDCVLWRADAAGATQVTGTPTRFSTAVPLGDMDGDGLADLGLHHEDASATVTLFPGPFVDTLPAAGAVVTSTDLLDVVPLGDVDGDGYADLALRGERIYVLRGPLTTRDGDAPDARVGAETDDLDESALFVTAGDIGADGTADLVVTDTYAPGRVGADALRGAVYTFRGLPSGVVDVRGAATRVYGTDYGAFGAYPDVLDDGRLLTGAHLLTHADGVGVFFLLEGL
jgi:hypothetical protein